MASHRCQPPTRNGVDRLKAWAHELLCRSQCLVCGARGERHGVDLCGGCQSDCEPVTHACPRCAQPLAPGVTNVNCGQCLRRPPRFQAAFCAFHYREPVADLVRRLKYRDGLPSGRLLASMFAEQLLRSGRALPDCIVPVPLSARRFAERGFNQSIELGRAIARAVGSPLVCDALVRERHTQEQAGLKPLARRRNVRGAFRVVKPLDADHVAILDDVMTTGSTVNEVARVLRRAGVRYIEVWAIARAGQRYR